MTYNGWLFRWWHRLICGAVYGHQWKKDAEDLTGHVICTCVKCGKTAVF